MKCLINDEMDCINETGECLICQYFLESLKEFENREDNKTKNKNNDDEGNNRDQK